MAGANLNPEEVDALMSAIQTGRVAPNGDSAKSPVVAYDLTSQDRVIRGQMPTLDAINERIASMLGVGLSGRTRRAIRVTSSPASLLKFQDISSLLAPPATVCVLALGKASGQAIVVLEPGLADALLAAALGDRKARPDEVSTEPRRDLTSVERQVLKRLISILTDGMATAWSPVLALKPEVSRFESDPRLAAIAPPNEAAILSSFELSGAITGRMQLAFPYSTVEGVKKQLSSPPRMSAAGDNAFASALEDELLNVTVQLRVVLGKAHVSLSRLLDIEKGDLLMLDRSEDAPLDVTIQGRNKLTGQPTVAGGNIALTIERGVSRNTPAALEKP